MAFFLWGGTNLAEVRAYTYRGGTTIDAYLGCGRTIEETLTPYEGTSYFLGTPYWGRDYFGYGAEYHLRANGDVHGTGFMNCTGFVSNVCRKAGGSLGRIRGGGTGAYANALNWFYTMRSCGIAYYRFSSISEALSSGLLQKGDLIYFEPYSWSVPGADCHIGIFWGNTSSDNKFWHSYPPGNQISNIKPVVASTMYVMPVRHEPTPASWDGVFDARYYVLAYPDLLEACGLDEKALFKHFRTTGLYEGRQASAGFAIRDYMAQNPDLYAVYGDNPLYYVSHFLRNGIHENRPTVSGFDLNSYIWRHPDLQMAFGLDLKGYFLHWVHDGYWEGRDGSSAVSSIPPEEGSGSNSVLRLRSTFTGAHLLTMDAHERATLMVQGWVPEGIAWNFNEEEGTPVHLLFSPDGRDRLFVSDETELFWLVYLGWSERGTAGLSGNPETGVPVWRLSCWDGTHFYTASEAEKNALLEANLITSEGIAFYAKP